MYLTTTFLGDVITFVLTITVLLTLYVRWNLTYWKRKNIPSVSASWNLTNVRLFTHEYYNRFKKLGERAYGLHVFMRPTLIVIDPELVKNVMIKDFQYFNDRGLYFNPEQDPLTNHLFNAKGSEWKNMRVKMTPVFTSGKMKMMFNIISKCSNILVENLSSIAIKTPDIDIKECLACYTTDVIGSCAFGLEFNSLKDSDSEFRRHGRNLFNNNRNIKRLFLTFYPGLGKWFKIALMDKELTKFFLGVVKSTINYREKNNYRRDDFLQILIDLRNNNTGDTSLTIKEIAAQCFLFFVAGFETSSSTLTFTLHELALNKDIQDKLRHEINTVLKKHDDKITYESIAEMKYAGQVIDETLRKYPVVPTIIRLCEKDYTIPDTDIVIDKGTTIGIPVLAIHHDDEYYPNPSKFDPDRFDETNKSSIPPNVYMPFGDGPRICIGLRFGYMQTKVGLVNLIRNYEFTMSEMTKPIVLNESKFITATVDPIYLKTKKIT